MAAGLTHRVWDLDDVVAIMDEIAPKPGRPKTYKKRPTDRLSPPVNPQDELQGFWQHNEYLLHVQRQR